VPNENKAARGKLIHKLAVCRGCPSIRRHIRCEMTVRKGFANAKMRLRRHQYHGVIEITCATVEVHDVLDEWQSLYPIPKGARPLDFEMLEWEPLPAKPEGLPRFPAKAGPRDVLIWNSTNLTAVIPRTGVLA
jgi:hypothetical protein